MKTLEPEVDAGATQSVNKSVGRSVLQPGQPDSLTPGQFGHENDKSVGRFVYPVGQSVLQVST